MRGCSKSCHVTSFLAAAQPSKAAFESLQSSAEQPEAMVRPRGKEWDYVVVTIEVTAGQNGDPEVECIFCTREPFRAGATRIRAHILGDRPSLGVSACEPREEEIDAHAAAVAALQAVQRSAGQVQIRKRKAEKLASHEASAAAASSSGRQSTITEGFQEIDRAGADRAVASMWYANGLAFNVARNAYTKAAFRAISQAGPGYTLPRSEKLRTNLLDGMFSHVEAQLQPAKDSRASLGCTITGDGWTVQLSVRVLLTGVSATNTGILYCRVCRVGSGYTVHHTT